MAGGEANVRRRSSTLSQDSSLFSAGLLGGDSKGEIIALKHPGKASTQMQREPRRRPTASSGNQALGEVSLRLRGTHQLPSGKISFLLFSLSLSPNYTFFCGQNPQAQHKLSQPGKGQQAGTRLYLSTRVHLCRQCLPLQSETGSPLPLFLGADRVLRSRVQMQGPPQAPVPTWCSAQVRSGRF